MLRSPKALVKPEILVWAREAAGYSIAEVARRLRIKEERVEAWESESGDDQPTVKQLRRLAQTYKRPMAVFYLQEIPSRFQVMHDFRRLPSDGRPEYSPGLLFEIRSAQQRRALTLELLDEIGEEPEPLRLTATLNENPENIGSRIREALGITYSIQSQWRQPRKGLNEWRGRLEGLGVMVFQASRVPTSEMRGFSLAEAPLPVIVINRKDAPNGRVFSLLHELAHLMIRRSGLCELDENGHRREEDQAVEAFCNGVAAAALMPAPEFLAEAVITARSALSEQWDDQEITYLSRQYCVSREAVTRRLLTLERTTVRFYQRKRAQFHKELEQRRARDQERMMDYRRNLPQEAVSDFGKPFVRLVLDNYYQDRITLSDVSSYLNIRTKHLSAVEQRVVK